MLLECSSRMLYYPSFICVDDKYRDITEMTERHRVEVIKVDEKLLRRLHEKLKKIESASKTEGIFNVIYQ